MFNVCDVSLFLSNDFFNSIMLIIFIIMSSVHLFNIIECRLKNMPAPPAVSAYHTCFTLSHMRVVESVGWY